MFSICTLAFLGINLLANRQDLSPLPAVYSRVNKPEYLTVGHSHSHRRYFNG